MAKKNRPNVVFEPGMQTREYDRELVVASLLHGGIQKEDLSDCSVVIKPTERMFIGGRAIDKHPDYNNKPVIEAFSYKGAGPVATTLIAHEARHLADMMYIGESAFTSDNTRRARKSVAALTGLAASYFFGKNIGLDPGLQGEEIIDLATGLVLADTFLTGSLNVEYITRPHERRAFSAERNIEKQNILRVSEEQEMPNRVAYAAMGMARAVFVPNFNI